MNILNKVTWQALKKNRTRTAVTIIGVILSAAMFTAVTTLGVSCLTFLMDLAIYQTGDYFLQADYVTDEGVAVFRQEKAVTQMGDLKTLGYTTFTATREDGSEVSEDCIIAAGDEDFFDMVTIHLVEGRLPQRSSEIVITENIRSYLEVAGRPSSLGQTLTLELRPEYDGAMELPSIGGSPATQTYTIVGVAEDLLMDDANLFVRSLVTYADGSEGDAHWHRLYVKTIPAGAAYDLMDLSLPGAALRPNSSLLSCYGATRYSNFNSTITLICLILALIIMVGSVSLIYNAFSISVSERTRQFGLLRSIGATRKQLRKSVYFEALAISAIGIPLGILCGYGGIAVTLGCLGGIIEDVFGGAHYAGSVSFRAVPSAPAFLAAGTIALLTVFLSAWLPAKRATRVTPLAAIRQTQDYQVPKKDVKVSRLTTKLWGLPGLMAKKYYAASRKKYRTTVISLTISILLFLSATSFAVVLQTAANTAVNTNNFDIICYNLTESQLKAVRNLPGVSKSALQYQQQRTTIIPDEDLSQEYLELYEQFRDNPSNHSSRNSKYLYIHYLEDQEFRDYLAQQGIDPEPYFADDPAALVCRARLRIDTPTEDPNKYTRTLYEVDIFTEDCTSLSVLPAYCPEELEAYLEEEYGISFYYGLEIRDERILWSFYPRETPPAGSGIWDIGEDETIYVAVVPETDGDKIRYYWYDITSDTLVGEPICTMAQESPLRLGQSVADLPYGITDNTSIGGSNILVVLPLSAAGEIALEEANLVLSVSDYDSVIAYLDSQEIVYSDYLRSHIQARNLVFMVNVFSYGFIILISLICVCNVFNTISTNIALRRRDFGMLRSVGMKPGELYRMMGFECLRYGTRALILGLPLGIAANFGIHTVLWDIGNAPYTLPLVDIAIAAGTVFAVVFISMLYGVSKLRGDNPIEAIRQENL